jgi:ABC-type uncharacterized transport system ATPase subunit
MTPLVLELSHISKRFGSVVALDEASLSVHRQSIHALVGENGAGKTTLMRIAFGLLRPDAGTIAVDDSPRVFSSPADAIAAGIGMVHQQFSLVTQMTVAENIALGGRGRFRPEEVARRIITIGRETGLVLQPERRVDTLSNAEKQKLEIVRTLAHDARILILDEPTTVLTARDRGELFAQLKLFTDSGGSVILITHKLQDAMTHADEVTVLRRGRMVLTSAMSAVDRPALTEAMFGFRPEPGPPEQLVDRVAAASAVARLIDVVIPGRASVEIPLSLDVIGGEILGIAGLDGGASGLLRTLAGRLESRSGRVELPSLIGFVPEDRQHEALIPAFSLTDNVALKDAGQRRGLIDWKKMTRRTSGVLERFAVRSDGPSAPAQTLSGGNQQRFVLARELDENPPLLILENPTQGLDVDATAIVHDRVRSAAAAGTAVVFYSSDLDELAEISHRVLVVRSSGIALTEPERESIGHLLLEN